MTRLKKYIKESRSKELSKEETTDILKRDCSEAVERYREGYPIYRSVNHVEDFLITKPTGDRKSAYSAGNYYTLGINNDELGEKFPKRSVICASGKRAIEHGGETYIVLPFNGAKIGICPTDDIGDSFKDLKDINADGDELNIFLNKVVGEDLSGNEFKKKAERIDPDSLDPGSMNLNFTDRAIIEDWEIGGADLYTYLQDLLDPKYNNFMLQDTSNYMITFKDNREVWTDSNCILLKYENLEILDELEK